MSVLLSASGAPSEAVAAPAEIYAPTADDANAFTMLPGEVGSATVLADLPEFAPYDPLEAEGPLRGLSGAATALSIKDYKLAAQLADGAGGADAVPGSDAWFWLGALKGRALRESGDPGAAVEVLSPLWADPKLARHFPKETLGFELARSKVAWAASGSLALAEADTQRKQAIAILSIARKLSPIRNLAQMRVLQAEAMLQMQGSTPVTRKRAARRAVRAAGKLLRDYPSHPRVGQLWLARADALVRAGNPYEAAKELRAISIRRAGEPEDTQAWTRLQALAREHKKIRARPLSRTGILQKAAVARGRRWVELSRKLLDGLIADPKTPGHIRRQARSSRAYTAYKQRDYQVCINDLLPRYERTGNYEMRDRVLRCMERGAFYSEALAIWDRQADSKRRGMRAYALWQATQLAVRGGRYAEAEGYLHSYEELSSGNRQLRLWLHAWLPMRLGRVDEAIAGFEAMQRYASDALRARYFRGKLMLVHTDPELVKAGEMLLKAVIDRNPLGYYGLQARQRLLDAKVKVSDPPNLVPAAGEMSHPTRAQTQTRLEALNVQFGSAWPPIARGRQYYAAGYLEEARRELRIGEQAHRSRGARVGGVRSEAFLVGLGWKSEWSSPRVAPTRAGAKTLRNAQTREQLRIGFRDLARGIDEPHRVSRLSTTADGSWKARWHPRAYRAAVEREARLQHIDPVHMWSLMYTESRFRRFVVSPVGARGALQIMPWTGRQLAQRLGELEPGMPFDNDSLFDIDVNAHLAGYYVAELLRKFHGQGPMAYASYNGGPSNVARWLAAKSNAPAPLHMDTFVEEMVFRESYRYSKRVVEVSAAYSLLYSGKLPRWSNDVDAKFEDNISF